MARLTIIESFEQFKALIDADSFAFLVGLSDEMIKPKLVFVKSDQDMYTVVEFLDFLKIREDGMMRARIIEDEELKNVFLNFFTEEHLQFVNGEEYMDMCKDLADSQIISINEEVIE